MRRRLGTPRGFTLVELVLALGLLSLLVLALVQLLDTSTRIWGRAEESRELHETADAVFDLLAEDWSSLERGPRGDLLVDWTRFDPNGDGIAGLPWPRLRLVRQAPAARLVRLDPTGRWKPRERGWIEVAWALLPPHRGDPNPQAGVLWRGERRTDDPESLSYFDPRFFGADGRPVPGALDEVADGVLWLDVALAGPMTSLSGGWEIGSQPGDAFAAWDARGLERPDGGAVEWNGTAAAIRVDTPPALPRRVRVELELEGTRELARRTRTTSLVEADQGTFAVADDSRLPSPGAWILVDEEWMRVTSSGGGRVSVRRGERGTRPAVHPSGRTVHFGVRFTREFVLRGGGEAWKP